MTEIRFPHLINYFTLGKLRRAFPTLVIYSGSAEVTEIHLDTFMRTLADYGIPFEAIKK